MVSQRVSPYWRISGAVTIRELAVETRFPAERRNAGSAASVRIAFSDGTSCGATVVVIESALKLYAMLRGPWPSPGAVPNSSS